MRGKIIFVVGLATGYVLGTRAGRERYEQIKAGADKVWNTRPVQAAAGKAQDFADKRVDEVKASLSRAARNALAGLLGREPLTGPQQSSAAKSVGSTKATPPKPRAATASAKSSAAKPAAAKSSTAKPAASTPAKTTGGTAAAKKPEGEKADQASSDGDE
ncbi:hypothetical protein [Herbiconiux solani]|uniref:hypothetical protein n=1 Tax=Herbiconiux solani TaxID=661329 RepID=UPI000825DD22|nr:hypothetical protein [Herbiconiux solani]